MLCSSVFGRACSSPSSHRCAQSVALARVGEAEEATEANGVRSRLRASPPAKKKAMKPKKLPKTEALVRVSKVEEVRLTRNQRSEEAKKRRKCATDAEEDENFCLCLYKIDK
jgi:hypothetical protein